jgi:hypothetical protein
MALSRRLRPCSRRRPPGALEVACILDVVVEAQVRRIAESV